MSRWNSISKRAPRIGIFAIEVMLLNLMETWRKKYSFPTKLLVSSFVDDELLMPRASGNSFSRSRECLLHRERPRRDIRASVTYTVPISDFVNQQALRPHYPTRCDKKIERNPTVAVESDASRINNVFSKSFPAGEACRVAVSVNHC